ncbi:haloperoxidase [Clostridium botulinum]|uniref:vanadium-dependent haloperoxidase n=1 Tax=Clostridium botulinum TaxID=1491 RepID=UPI0006A7295C|nr:vanadium-dependent haloperoxidase [Clostridium botulinum]KOM95864.1 haloperoxidase [Clostridium botulinum]KON02153.1 haloperoxidase [Clostridium botulinum]MBY7005563.1 vanadium-dependent haloperoxidase [Clostridium botulinum]MCR1148180.1 vanadium-dependent haloperoxidase [Clostridium botulinum]NFH95227.1 vanadium-dependent haloperoxidase [Clostridium botulinum]
MEEKQDKNIEKYEGEDKVCINKPACPKNTIINQCEIGPLTPEQRRIEAFEKRSQSALFQKNLILQGQRCNDDEILYANKIGNYTKALPHNSLGEVNLEAYNIWISTLTTGNPEKFELIPLGGTRKFVNPQAAYAYEMVGPDSHHLTIAPAPGFSSVIEASEMAEDYWMALTRDVPFVDYDTNPKTKAAAEDLSKFSAYDGPKCKGKVTTETLFRSNVPDTLEGPYVSQFLLKDIPFGVKTITQKYIVPVEKIDYMTSYNEWLNIQNGQAPSSILKLDSVPRYISNGRDLGEYIHKDNSIQAALTACSILLDFGQEALSLSNPYLFSKTQEGFITFGTAHVLDFMTRVSRMALEAAWFQKFLVHRRLRPEEFGRCVQNLKTGDAKYPINPELLDSKVLEIVFKKYGTYLLPMAYTEGCPTHPAYPAGHATLIGAGVTILKAFFNEDYIIPNPVVASADGLDLQPYLEDDLKVGGELNKLAANIALGRDFAGVHWRSDCLEGMRLGEAVAIGLLQDYRNTYNEEFHGFSFTKFDGTKVII